MSNEKEKLNLWQKSYITEIIRGVWITSKHFFRNLFTHIMHLFGFSKTKPAMVTYQYPEESRPFSPRIRTRHRLMKRENGSTRCVACMMCETICPAHCIYIVAEEDSDPYIEKRPKIFEIDLGKCIYCGFCVEACPEDAIRMDTYIQDLSSYKREDFILTLDELMNHDNGDMYPEFTVVKDMY